ncbi:site-specific integrase [Streptococcus uberis]|uniref:Tyrosine-type recombinase/integrase n=1 Tax=Streptococcus uberis TaxID=1349 RepID=A0A6L6G6Y7_STRUB|nr:site-specific integrase [Streptococcus uberis]MCK1236774.1 site-specific integrase [Streptococcus uberis]MTB98512.1 tyrosine-type recombinase/integrase [Streptococcus uberis]MTC84371.1 tyrosine-type recombinase/integrase [Streptococcus uberis]MTC86716.1 tyrosine-type recombinase/integrase [Streptococcus uberis]MTD01163.1 tyrosine-type recombinase/integrase [Streptococcus uberis]
MKNEIILHNNKKITKQTKNNGDISYILRGVYLGKDKKTGKQITTSITAKNLRQLDKKLIKAKLEFENEGKTRKETFSVSRFEELCELWFSSFKTWVSSQNTINRVRSYLDTYILPEFGEYKPENIESVDIQLWINRLAKQSIQSVASGVKKSQKGHSKDFGAIAHKLDDIFDFGIINFGLNRNPVKGIKIPPKPKSPKKRIRVLHDEELSIWLAYLETLENTRANRRFKIICNTLLASALRINELLALTIDDLDCKTNEIMVSKTLLWKAGNKSKGIKGEMVCKQSPKSDSGNRRVIVPKEIISELIDFHNEMNNYFKEHSLPTTKLIFPTIYGNYMCDRNERLTLKKRLSSLNLPDYGFHIFRHTHASMMLNAGANWKELQVRMGHKSISTTMDTYAELAPTRKQEAVEIFLNKISELTN